MHHDILGIIRAAPHSAARRGNPMAPSTDLRRTDLSRMESQAKSRRGTPKAAPTVVATLEAAPKRAKPLIRQYDLVERVRKYNPHTDEHQLDDATIAAALLHDTIEDTETTRAEIDQLFGRDIGRLVEGLTKLKKLDLVSREAKQAENLRKLLLAIAEDVRVLLVKLADRLHNMRTIEYMRPEARRRVAEETIDIYAPLAGRIGMYELREELETLSFRELNPDAHKVVGERLEALEKRHLGLIAEIEAQLTRKLATRGIAAAVKGRRKRPYSIWRKMERKAVGFEQLSDIFGFRVIVKTMPECYQALGVVHTTWPVVPGRFKDYVSTPKQNDYRSIHTTVIGPSRQRVELQIRTRTMHQIAEYGIAAHALYKDGVGSPTEMLSRESSAYAWLRRTIELLAEGSNPEEFLE